jgi:hypothetical protein
MQRSENTNHSWFLTMITMQTNIIHGSYSSNLKLPWIWRCGQGFKVVSGELARIASNLKYSLPNLELPIQGDDTCWSGGGGADSIDGVAPTGRERWAAPIGRWSGVGRRVATAGRRAAPAVMSLGWLGGHW